MFWESESFGALSANLRSAATSTIPELMAQQTTTIGQCKDSHVNTYS